MTCRHSKGDPSCSSSAEYVRREYEAKTPDKRNYEILDVWCSGSYMVLKVKYPNCSSCSYEGTKVMVFADVDALVAMKWKEVDPHFRDPESGPKGWLLNTRAPTPIARFPGSDSGWQDACDYALHKGR